MCRILLTMEHEFIGPLRTIVDDEKTSCIFKVRDDILDGSFLIGILRHHGMVKLQEVLNYHNLEDRHNLLRYNLKIGYIDTIRSVCKTNYSFHDEHLIHHLHNEYNPVLEYVIINHTIADINIIIEQLETDPNITIWDYKTRTINFGKYKYLDIEYVTIATVLKIITDNNINDHTIDNCMYLLTNYLRKIVISEKHLLVITVFLFRKGMTNFLNRFTKLMDTQFQHYTYKWPISFELEYNYKIFL